MLFDGQFTQFGLLKNVRWIASRAKALNLLETNYKVIVLNLENKLYRSSDRAKKALGYVEFLKTPNFLVCLHFF